MIFAVVNILMRIIRKLKNVNNRIAENIKEYIHEIPINTSLRVNIDK